jgi:hypothetical protein
MCVCVIILSIVGFVVFVKRNKHGSEYKTKEGDKESGSGPQGVDYEQNPEREALTKDDQKNHNEEVLM